MNQKLKKDTREIILLAEVDEQWSFVQKKHQQRWLWYALDKLTGKVMAYVFGRRTDGTCKKLLGLLKDFPIKHWFTDDWGSYERCLPAEKHTVSKRYTQGIERRNLNFRTRIKRLARKTICFSKLPEIHDKLIWTFIEWYEF